MPVSESVHMCLYGACFSANPAHAENKGQALKTSFTFSVITETSSPVAATPLV